MDDKTTLEILRKIRGSQIKFQEIRKSTNNEISAIGLAMDEAIDDDSTDLDAIRKLKLDRTNKESYRKQINSKLNKMTAAFDDALFGKGEFDIDQLSLFENKDVESEESEGEKKPFFQEVEE